MAYRSKSISFLKKFSRERAETLSDLFDILIDLEQESDRAVAIIGGTRAEDALEFALTRKMRRLSSSDSDGLFVGDSPLATFSAKIKIGYAFKLFNSDTRNELDKIRELRNAFAHSRRRLTFKTKQVIAVCNSLKSPNRFPPDDPAYVRDARGKFILTINTLWVELLDAGDPKTRPEFKAAGMLSDVLEKLETSPRK